MSRMVDCGRTCETCRYLDWSAQLSPQAVGMVGDKKQCIEESRTVPIWVEPSEGCDKWEAR